MGVGFVDSLEVEMRDEVRETGGERKIVGLLGLGSIAFDGDRLSLAGSWVYV